MNGIEFNLARAVGPALAGALIAAAGGEHLRQHARLTQADRELEDRVRALVLDEPRVRHLIDARRGRAIDA